MSIILHGAALSPFVRKVRIVLLEKQLEHEQVHLNPFKKSPELMALNPLGKIPILEDADSKLADSAVISHYLEDKYPDISLYPKDPYEKARVLWFEKYADYEIAPAATFRIFSNRVVKPMMGQPCDESKVSAALQQLLPPLLDYLEIELNNNHANGFIVGNQISIADIAIASQFINMSLGDERPDADKWPVFNDYLQSLLRRPSIAELSHQDHALVAQLLNKTPA